MSRCVSMNCMASPYITRAHAGKTTDKAHGLFIKKRPEGRFHQDGDLDSPSVISHQLPTRPPSSFVMTIVAERGRANAPPAP